MAAAVCPQKLLLLPLWLPLWLHTIPKAFLMMTEAASSNGTSSLDEDFNKWWWSYAICIQQIFCNVCTNLARPGLYFPLSLSRGAWAPSVWGRAQALCLQLELKAAASVSTVQNKLPRGADWSNVVLLSPWWLCQPRSLCSGTVLVLKAPKCSNPARAPCRKALVLIVPLGAAVR